MRAKSDNHPDVRVARLAGEQFGVLSLDELLRCGLSSSSIGRRVLTGRLHPLYQGVYAVGHSATSLEGQFLAALKACGPDAVLSHFSAAALWELVDWDERHPEVTILGTAPRLHPGIRVHRTRLLDPRDRRMHKGIPVTSPARTAVDIASQLPFAPARRAVRQAISRRLLSVAELVEILARHPRRPGAGKLRRILASGAVPTRSVLEDLVLDLILLAGLEHPDVNVPLVLDGRRVVPDFRWPVRRLVVEADGRAWHDDELTREDDIARQALLEAHGERVMRITWKQAVGQRAQTISRLRAAAREPHASRPPGP